MKGLNKQDKMSTKRIQLNPVHKGKTKLFSKYLNKINKNLLNIKSSGVFCFTGFSSFSHRDLKGDRDGHFLPKKLIRII